VFTKSMKAHFGKVRDSDFLRQTDELSAVEDKEAKLRANLREKSLQMLKGLHDRIPEIFSNLADVSSSLETVLNKQEKLEDRISKLESLVKTLAQETSGLSTKIDVTDRNLHQVRLLNEGIANKVDNLSQEFIDRFVKEPLIKDVGIIFNGIRQKKGKDDSENVELLEQFRLILESHETTIIEPQRGSVFDPKEHKPVKNIETQLESMDRRICCTYSVGLKFKGRVIQSAIVGLFSLNKNSEN